MKEYTLNPGYRVIEAKLTQYKSVDNTVKVMTETDNQYFNKLLNEQMEKARKEFNVQLDIERRKAVQEGIEKGKKQALDQYATQFQKAFALLENINTTYKNEFKNLLEKEESNILSLIIDIAEKVVQVEVSLNEEIILGITRKCLQLLNDKKKVRILVNPADWMLIKENLATLKMKAEITDDIEVVNYDEIEQGGCKVECETGSVDGTLASQFDELKRKLLKETLNR